MTAAPSHRSGIEVLRAALPPSPGINRTYRTTRGGRWYKTDSARLWQDQAVLHLRAAGFFIHEPGAYWLECFCGFHTRRFDLDAPVKLLLDTLTIALGIDDRWLGRLGVAKVWEPDQARQRLEIEVTIARLPDREVWAAWSRRED